MEKRPIEKERLGAIVAFPRSQYKGLEMTGTMPCQEDYTVKEVQVEGMGVVKMVRSERVPHRTMQVFECHSDMEFDQCLGKLLGMGETPAYIEGDTSFMVLFVGSCIVCVMPTDPSIQRIMGIPVLGFVGYLLGIGCMIYAARRIGKGR